MWYRREGLDKNCGVLTGYTDCFISFFIKGLDDQAIIDIFVTDISGSLVVKKELVYPFQLETNDLVSGVYSLLVADRRGNSFTLKMIKN